MKHVMKFGGIALAAWAMSASPVFADDVAELEAAGVSVWQSLPRPSEMIRHPGPESYAFYGSAEKAAKRVTAADVPGNAAMRIKVKRAGKNPWDAGANVTTQLETKKGDVLVAVVYARAAKLPEGASSAQLPIHIQQQGGAYKQYGSHTANLTKDWGRYTVYGTLDKDYKKGAVGAAVHLATGKQTIELGPVYLMNMGQGGVDSNAMPKASAVN